MKKILKSRIFCFIIGGLLFSFISVYAYSIAATEVSFQSTKSEFTATTVGSALDTLYDKSNDIFGRIDGSHYRAVNYGVMQQNQTATMELSKGNYYVFLAYTQSWYTDVIENADYTNNSLEYLQTAGRLELINVTCENVSVKS